MPLSNFIFFLEYIERFFQSSLHTISYFNDDNVMILVDLIFRFKQSIMQYQYTWFKCLIKKNK